MRWKALWRAAALGVLAYASTVFASPPVPLLADGRPVDWWFVFKFNGHDFPGCGAAVSRVCTFDGGKAPPDYGREGFGQQYVFASSADSRTAKGEGCIGQSADDPLGATFGHVFDGDYYYVVWNDQPMDAPAIPGCSASGGNCDAPWGHSKGLLAWDDSGAGMFLQVSTPSWPLAASRGTPRAGDANTLGCVADDDVRLSQHFFSLRLSHDDVVQVLLGLANASVGTDPTQKQLVRNGGPSDIQALVVALGRRVDNKGLIRVSLSSGVGLISKPSNLNAPPWQLVSSELGSVPLRTATFWNAPRIMSTDAATPVDCLDASFGRPGPVEVALTGRWDGTPINLGSGGNHAKLGVSLDPQRPFVVFGDENQQGQLSVRCDSSQNGRGGLFFVLKDGTLAAGVLDLLTGQTAPLLDQNAKALP